MAPITLIIIGAGSRGANYAEYAISHPDQAQVVGVADPRVHYRMELPPGMASRRATSSPTGGRLPSVPGSPTR